MAMKQILTDELLNTLHDLDGDDGVTVHSQSKQLDPCQSELNLRGGRVF